MLYKIKDVDMLMTNKGWIWSSAERLRERWIAFQMNVSTEFFNFRNLEREPCFPHAKREGNIFSTIFRA